MNKKILIVEDDTRLAQVLSKEFCDNNYEVLVATKLAEITDQVFDFAVVDLRLKGEFGLNLIPIIKERSPDCRIVILTGYGSVSTAVEAIKLGASEYLTKPVSFEQLHQTLLGQKSVVDEDDLQRPSLSQMEHEYIDYVLTKNKGNISKTAKALGLHRQSLQRKLKKYT